MTWTLCGRMEGTDESTWLLREPIQYLNCSSWCTFWEDVNQGTVRGQEGQFFKSLHICELQICNFGQILTINFHINWKYFVIYDRMVNNYEDIFLLNRPRGCSSINRQRRETLWNETDRNLRDKNNQFTLKIKIASIFIKNAFIFIKMNCLRPASAMDFMKN